MGFRVAGELGRRHGAKLSARKARSFVGEARVSGREVALARPRTYMNNSGRAAVALLERFGAGPEEMLVVCDDFHLDLGVLRIRRSGSSGGQKGLQSIIDLVGTTEFPRLRLGIGPAGGDPVEFVLGEFRKNERPEVDEAVGRAADACELWVEEGIEACMAAFN